MLEFGDDRFSGLACAYVEQAPELRKNILKIKKRVATRGSHSLLRPLVIPSLYSMTCCSYDNVL